MRAWRSCIALAAWDKASQGLQVIREHEDPLHRLHLLSVLPVDQGAGHRNACTCVSPRARSQAPSGLNWSPLAQPVTFRAAVIRQVRAGPRTKTTAAPPGSAVARSISGVVATS